MARTITVAAAQTSPVLSDDMCVGLDEACRMVEEAARRGTDIICFSELFLTPFFPNRLTQDFAKYFIELSDPVVAPLIDLAREREIALIFPFGERDGRYFYNSAAVFDRRGRHLGTYRKTHIPAILPSGLQGGSGSYEKFYFSPGTELPVYELDGIKIGIQICYDRKYPEGSRVLALKGAQVLFMPICAASYGEIKLRGNTWELPLQARAYENGVFVVAVNRCGDENGRNHIGKSLIVDPVGADIVAMASIDTPEVLVATLNLGSVEVAQTSLPWWRDRRPELYGELSAG
jgi:predicted amidohydrolase